MNRITPTTELEKRLAERFIQDALAGQLDIRENHPSYPSIERTSPIWNFDDEFSGDDIGLLHRSYLTESGPAHFSLPVRLFLADHRREYEDGADRISLCWEIIPCNWSEQLIHPTEYGKRGMSGEINDQWAPMARDERDDDAYFSREIDRDAIILA